MTRTILIPLTALLLAGCVDTSASYYVDGPDHAVTVRAEQDYFWSDEVSLKLIASRLPDCQRQLALTTLPLSGLDVELYASGENGFTLRAGKQAWRVETQTCSQLAPPAQDEPGSRLGVFRLDGENRLVFEKATPAA